MKAEMSCVEFACRVLACRVKGLRVKGFDPSILFNPIQSILFRALLLVATILAVQVLSSAQVLFDQFFAEGPENVWRTWYASRATRESPLLALCIRMPCTNFPQQLCCCPCPPMFCCPCTQAGPLPEVKLTLSGYRQECGRL
jgi:hypothetical protein